jgi:hypothetical protein
MQSSRPLILTTALALLAGVASACERVADQSPPHVVELYTSEGCSSCPPADRWLSTLGGRPGVLAAAFHVDYWDRLGWRDRFASPAATQRQAAQQRRSGAGFNYTPQVLVDGHDWRSWPNLPAAATAPGAVLTLKREGARVSVDVRPLAGAPARITAWWAWVEDGHVSAVRAGENSGATLHHDDVARSFGERAPWDGTQAASWRLDVPAQLPEDAAHPRRLLVVVQDAASGHTLQAAQLGC